MKSIELKQEIHGYIEQADDKILQAIKTLVKPSITQIQLSKSQKLELDKRKTAHTSGKSKSFTWEQTEKMLKSRKK
jgi:putative addiction module component (TIGR02574 family)